MLKASPTLTDVEYPESDGEPMAETDTHRIQMTDALIYPRRFEQKTAPIRRAGVREYFLFDPLREYLRPPSQGFRLVDDYYVPIMPEQIDNGEWQTSSEVLELILRTEGSNLRLYDPEQERYLLMPAEEAEARRAAEAEVERLRALLAQQSSEQ